MYNTFIVDTKKIKQFNRNASQIVVHLITRYKILYFSKIINKYLYDINTRFLGTITLSLTLWVHVQFIRQIK